MTAHWNRDSQPWLEGWIDEVEPGHTNAEPANGA